MKKRFRFFICVCILIVFTFMTSCTHCEESVEYFSPVQKEVIVVAEFGKIMNSNNEEMGVGVVSFKVGNILYAMGHSSSIKDISSLLVYKVPVTFDPCTKKHLGQVIPDENAEGLLGKVTQDSDNGMIISAQSFNEENYSTITIANSIFSGEAQVLMRDETGELQSYSISVIVVTKRKEEYLEITVTDEKLLSKTGGIIPGMSGSPIVQEGKLIGVVTHTYVNRPWQGRGKIIWNIDCIKTK